MIWAVLRFEIPGAGLGMPVITGLALTGTTLGQGPFTRGESLDSLLLLQGYVAVMGLTSLVLAVEVGLRRRTQARLKESEQGLDFALWGTDPGALGLGVRQRPDLLQRAMGPAARL